MSVLSGCIKIEVSIHKFVYKEGESILPQTFVYVHVLWQTCICREKNIPSKKSATEKFKRKIKAKRINLTYM